MDEIHLLLETTHCATRSFEDPRFSPSATADGARSQALTDGARASPGVLLQQLHDVGFLGGRAAAAHHGRALAGQLHELVLVVLEADLGNRAL